MRAISKNIFRLLFLIIVLDIIYIATLWVRIGVETTGIIPYSSFMKAYQNNRDGNVKLPELRFYPLPLNNIPRRVKKVFIIAEDSHFFVHHGFDFKSIKLALIETFNRQAFSRGGSSITQQTAKNLFLYPQRTLIRKWHEMILTIIMEMLFTKERILELYLNIAEFGIGIYGVEAASRYYFGVSVKLISTEQAAGLAAALPWPQRHNPKTATQVYKSNKVRLNRRANKEHFPE